MGIEQVRGGLYRLLLGRFQAYLWRDPDGVTLIDSGPADAGADIAAALDEIGLAPPDVDRLVLTHFHDDHTGAAAEIRDWGDVEVVAHAADAPIIRGATPRPPPQLTDAERDLVARITPELPAAPPVEVDREVHGGDVLDFAGGAHVIAAPGHTEGSIALHLPAHGVLITGDAAAESLGRVIPGGFDVDPGEAARTLRRLAELDVDVAVFGHGEPARENARARLRAAAGPLASGS